METARLGWAAEALGRRRVAPVVKLVADAFGYSVQELAAKDCKLQDVSLARKVAMYVAREVTGRSFGEIGRILGRTKKPVMWACGDIAGRVQKNEELRGVVEKLITQARA